MEPTVSSTTHTMPERCGICRSDESEEPPVTLPCRHMFHSDCIRRWLPLGKPEPHCPYCRRSLTHSCGHMVKRSVLEPGAVMPPNSLAGDCNPCIFKKGFKSYYGAVRHAMMVYMIMSEAWPGESDILISKDPGIGSWRAEALARAWSSLQKLRATLGGVIDFAQQWHKLPKSDYRRSDETPGVEKLEALEHLRSAVQAASSITFSPTGMAVDRGPCAGPITTITIIDGFVTGVPEWVPGKFSPSRFPDLYQSLHRLTRAFGYGDPLHLAIYCEDVENQLAEADDEDWDEEDEYDEDEEEHDWSDGDSSTQDDHSDGEDDGELRW